MEPARGWVLRWRHGSHGHRLAGGPRFPERVYFALIDPDALTAWLPPEGITGRFEARPGGSYRMMLAYEEASGAPGKTTHRIRCRGGLIRGAGSWGAGCAGRGLRL
ncbi:SRPBCC domain-containing protein [Kocuria flava]|uniref:SRPBCC domain-containing protein n=1 Tax=Kocuria flava TaxID=446860 RepID=UPI0027E3191A|nr:SRPBCC domain-containing protein [Kocuria flava]